MTVYLLASSSSAKRLLLKVALMSPKMQCTQSPNVEVVLIFLNATVPTCGQMKIETLCFPERDISPHIKENRMPGALRQLRRFTHADLCPNYTISYRVETGTFRNKG